MFTRDCALDLEGNGIMSTHVLLVGMESRDGVRCGHVELCSSVSSFLGGNHKSSRRVAILVLGLLEAFLGNGKKIRRGLDTTII